MLSAGDVTPRYDVCTVSFLGAGDPCHGDTADMPWILLLTDFGSWQATHTVK
jgi:hypothetical protein